MSVRKPLSLVAILTLVALAACSDISGPQQEGFCPVTGSDGTCSTGINSQH